ncbi:helix-turn-helix transcriptional regulator [Leekyejoonella antrihumi]|uniref:ArsR family transcriptional regulator n=1 Tax=Leekyejoonella antrihumi TaxID=1660198 RepID=A0A563DT36_9MICO|nr:helix-turn-helix domain-containing protein [Leekyejoonella antrihumi]TWP33417.1 ArsR family transcriptional regulator [Leekyejoonella antrihumi]
MVEPPPPEDATPDLSALADPVRRRLYDYVAAQKHPVPREAAAGAAEISRTLAAYHLDRLADAGLLATSYARPDGQSGPGAGRPAKHYRPAQEEVSLSVPPRNYTLLARLLADAVVSDDSGTVRSAVVAAAEVEGRATAAPGRDLLTTLTENGYQPEVAERGDVELRNCPFHQVSRRHAQLVCGLNHAFVRGALVGRGDDPDRAELAPQPGRCCIVIHPRALV